MFQRTTRVTFTDVLILGAIVATVASVAVPQIVSSRQQPDEAKAIRVLRNIALTQKQCQFSGIIDANNNGVGEPGFFGELTGIVPYRGAGTNRMNPPFFSEKFSDIDPMARAVLIAGYYFRLLLPGDPGGIVTEAANGGPEGPVQADAAEAHWGCLAWPADYGITGTRAFYIDRTGKILVSENKQQRYDGLAKMPENDAALRESDTPSLSTPAINAKGQDGQLWHELR